MLVVRRGGIALVQDVLLLLLCTRLHQLHAANGAMVMIPSGSVCLVWVSNEGLPPNVGQGFKHLSAPLVGHRRVSASSAECPQWVESGPNRPLPVAPPL